MLAYPPTPYYHCHFINETQNQTHQDGARQPPLARENRAPQRARTTTRQSAWRRRQTPETKTSPTKELIP